MPATRRREEIALMSYVLKKGKISDWAPNHPFAHEQISFVPDEIPEQLPIGRQGVTVSLSWGYETHSVRIGAARWRKIRQGNRVMARSKGWYEGRSFQCRWYFDLSEEDSLVVCYGDDGAEGWIGKISAATIDAGNRD